jgi:uncharacterized protein YjbJ (UPF0337 family)
MNKLQKKGELNEQKGRLKQQQADETGDRLRCIEGKEEELTGKLQKEMGRGDEAVEELMDEEDEKHPDPA